MRNTLTQKLSRDFYSRTLMTFFAMLLPVLWLAGGAGAANPVTTGLVMDLESGVGIYKDAAKTQPATAAGDAVYVWADQSGNSRDFIQGTLANRPAYQPVGLNGTPSIRFNGSTNALIASGIALNSPDLSSGSYTFVFTFAITGSVSNYPTLFAKTNGGGDRRVWMMTPPQNNGGLNHYFYFTRYNSNFFAGVLAKGAYASYANDAATVTYQYDAGINRQTTWTNGQQSASIIETLPAADTTNFYSVGAAASPGFEFTGDITGVAVYNRLLTASERAQVESYFRTQSAIPAPAFTPKNNIVYAGNSLVEGPNPGTGFAEATQSLLGTTASQYENLGIGGLTTTNALTSVSKVVDAAFVPNIPNIAVLWEGTNDLAQLNVGASVGYNNLVTYCQGRRAAGFQVIVLSVLPRTLTGNADASFEADRQAINTNLRNNWPSFASGFVDIGNDATVGQAGQNTNITYYNSDGTHLNTAGHAILAAQLLPVIKKLLVTSATTKRILR